MTKSKQKPVSKHAEAQRSYHQRQLERNMVRLSVYVPDSERDTFWGAIDELREEWRAKGVMD